MTSKGCLAIQESATVIIIIITPPDGVGYINNHIGTELHESESKSIKRFILINFEIVFLILLNVLRPPFCTLTLG